MNPTLIPLMHLAVNVAPPVFVDASPAGRRMIPLTGGIVSGGLSGKIVPGGDWQTSFPDGRLEISAHYALDIDGHGIVEVQSDGVRHGPPEVLAALAKGEQVEPSRYYFRTAIRLFTSAPGLLRLNAILAVSTGRRERDRVLLDVFEVT